MVTVRFSNELDRPLEFVVEPWAAAETIPPGARFAIHYPAPLGREDTSYAEYQAGMIRFWCEGETYEIDVNGRRIVT